MKTLKHISRIFIIVFLCITTISFASEKKDFIPKTDTLERYILKLSTKHPTLVDMGYRAGWELDWQVAHGKITKNYKNIAGARFEIGESYRSIGEIFAAQLWYSSAATYSDLFNEGYWSSSPNYQLGMIEKQKKDYSQAFYYFLKAARGNHNYGLYETGLAYKNGSGTIRNYIEAYAWFNICSSYSHGGKSNKALKEMDALEKLMPPESIEKAQALSKKYLEQRKKELERIRKMKK